MNVYLKFMSGDYLNAYQSDIDYPEKISTTKILKVSYLLKLKAQSNSISNLDEKHKAWGKKKKALNSRLNKYL